MSGRKITAPGLEYKRERYGFINSLQLRTRTIKRRVFGMGCATPPRAS